MTGAADIPVELVRRVREELPFSLVVTGYAAADLVEWARGRMAHYKVPRVVELVEELPMTASGKVHKVHKEALRARAAGTRTGTPA